MKLTNTLLWGAAVGVAMSFTSCRDEEGTVPGTDPNPNVIVYTYSTSSLKNPDNDIMVRFATNSATKDLYYLVEPTATAEAYIASHGEQAYFQYVVSNGTKHAEANGAGNYDIILTDLVGEYSITAVATDGKNLKGAADKFFGLDWEDIVPGEYTFGFMAGKGTIPEASFPTLQVCTTDKNLYRLKDVFGEGYSLKLYMMGIYGTDADGDSFQLFRFYQTPTSYTYGNYGTVSVRDVAAWQGSDSWAKNTNYMNFMYEDHTCVLRPQYNVTAGNIGYGQGASSDYFYPNE